MNFPKAERIRDEGNAAFRQKNIMLAMPVVFTVFFLWFPAGLVLYWLVNNLLSIGQQWMITRKIAASGG